MKNLMLAVTLLFTSQSFADFTLPRTTSSESVQAILYTALHDYRLADQASKYPTNFVTVSEKGPGLQIKNENASLICSSGAQDMLPVQGYACVSKGDISQWSSSADSVQAVTYEALYQLKTNGGAYANYVIQVGSLATLWIGDGQRELQCEARTLGIAAVMSYRCVFKTAK